MRSVRSLLGRRAPAAAPAAASPPVESSRPACAAPTSALYLFPNGDVRACCISTLLLGNLHRERLPDIWAGARRAELVDHIDRQDYSLGCASCGAEVAVEGHDASYPAQFDRFAGGDGAWPRTMGLYLSNVCNLQCVQCHGENSSSIRKFREGRPPLANPYDDRFFDDLAPFLPHLELAYFAGGEPFLIPEMYRAWSMLADLAPHVATEIVTNGMHWNNRVERALDGMSASIVVSMDGATAATFESIRVGSSFERVVANLDRFAAYAASRGTRCTINHCLMPQNHHEFADLLLFAEARGIHVDVSVVREPEHCSIARLPPDELAAVARRLQADDERLGDRLSHNRATWEAELHRIGTWASIDDDVRVSIGGRSRYTIMGFLVAGDGSTDLDAHHTRLADGGHDVYRIVLGPGDRIVGADPAACDLLDVAHGALDGVHADRLWPMFTDRFGRSRRLEELERGPDDARLVAEFADARLDILVVADRGADGVAHTAEIIFRVVPTDE